MDNVANEIHINASDINAVVWDYGSVGVLDIHLDIKTDCIKLPEPLDVDSDWVSLVILVEDRVVCFTTHFRHISGWIDGEWSLLRQFTPKERKESSEFISTFVQILNIHTSNFEYRKQDFDDVY